MSYLVPPPDPSPVVVVKDFGGYVNEYAAQTEVYRRTNREVRIHECHSACTMALSLPNVCVWKDSIFKFHQAYDPRNHVTNWAVTGQLYGTYPDAIRDRLGVPTKSFTVLRGAELIDLGVRDCTEPPGPRVIVASASPRPLPDALTGGIGWSTLTGRLGDVIPNLDSKSDGKPDAKPGTSRRAAPSVAPEMLAPTSSARQGSPAAEEGEAPAPGAIPLPPPRPAEFGRTLVATAPGLPPIPFVQKIAGSQPILPARFVPFPKRTI